MTFTAIVWSMKCLKNVLKKQQQLWSQSQNGLPSNCLFYLTNSSRFSITLIKIKAADPDEVEDVTTDFFWLFGIEQLII